MKGFERIVGSDCRAQAVPPSRSARRVVLLRSTHDLDLALRTADRIWLVDAGKIVAGAPEDLALSGALEAAFAGRHVVFDDEQGTFRLKSQTGLVVSLAAAGRLYHWTRRALQRAGYEVGEEGEIQIEAVESGAAARWRVRDGEDAREVGSLEEVLWVLRDLQRDTGVKSGEISDA